MYPSAAAFYFVISRVAAKSYTRKFFYDLSLPDSFVSGCYSSVNSRRSIFSADFPRQKAASPFSPTPSKNIFLPIRISRVPNYIGVSDDLLKISQEYLI